MSMDADVKREAANARKRINTRIDKVKQELSKAGIASTRFGRELKSTIKILQEMKESTYVYGKKDNDRYERTADEIRENIRRSESIAPSIKQFRKNMQTMHEMNLPFRKDAKEVGRYTETEVRVVFAATRTAWQGERYGERLARIMAETGIADLEEIISIVTDLVDTKTMKLIADKNGNEKIDNEEELQELSPNDSADSENKTSPPTGLEPVIEAANSLTLDDIRNEYRARHNIS